mgnify:CR=1 FL=1
MTKTKNKKTQDKILSFQLRSDPKKGLVGFMMKKGMFTSVVKAEIFLLAVSIFCFSASLYILGETFPIQY